MSIAEVSGQRFANKANGVASLDFPFPNDVTAGSIVTLLGATWIGTGGPLTLSVAKLSGVATLSAFNVRNPVSGFDWFGRGGTFIAYALVTGSGSLTLRATGSDIGTINAVTDEFSGVNAASPLDVDGGELTFGPGATGVTDTITTGYDNSLILGAVAADGVGSWIPGSGYTEIAEDLSGAYIPYSTAYRVAGVAGTYNVDWTWTLTTNVGSIVNVAIREFYTGGGIGPAAAIVPARPLRSQLRW